MTPNERAWRSWVMSMAHALYRKGGRREPFGRCLSQAWRMAKDLRAGEERRRAA